MNDVCLEAFNLQIFNQDGNESAILKIYYYIPPDLMFQRLPIKEKVKDITINQMRKGYLVDVLPSVDIQELVKIGGKVIEIYEGVIYRDNFEKSPFRKIIGKFFAFRQNYKDEGNDSMQVLVNLIMNSLYGVHIHKKINEFHSCKSGH